MKEDRKIKQGELFGHPAEVEDMPLTSKWINAHNLKKAIVKSLREQHSFAKAVVMSKDKGEITEEGDMFIRHYMSASEDMAAMILQTLNLREETINGSTALN